MGWGLTEELDYSRPQVGPDSDLQEQHDFSHWPEEEQDGGPGWQCD